MFHVYSSSVKGHEQIQQVAEIPCWGRFTTETQREQRLEIQREQRRRKRQHETTGTG